MNKKILNNNKGITLVSLIITIIVMAIISGVTLNVSRNRFKINNVKKMVNDIEFLDEKIKNYYLKYGGIPVLNQDEERIKYTYTELDFDKDANDNENYYIIDLKAIGNITLNYGKEGYEHPNESDDVYIINEKTHTIYYVKGIEFTDGNLYHSIKFNDGNLVAIGPTKPEINILSKGENSIEIEIIPGKDNISGIQKTEYSIKSTDIENNVTQTENTEISDRTVVGNLSINKAHEITATTTSNNGTSSQNIYKINEWIEKLNIGDYVNYSVHIPDVTLTDESQIIKDLTEYSGNTDSTQNTASTINKEKNIGWRVFDVKNGKLRLISAQQSLFEVKLQSYDGYNNSVYLIDGICDTLYSTSDKGKAQNIKIEDIEEKINRQVFDFTQYEGNDSIVKYGETSEYNNSFKFPNICVLEEGYQRANNLSNQDITLGLSEQFLPITGISNATDNLKITSNYWYHCMSSNEFRDSMYYELLIRKEDNSNFRYWISSRCINAGSDAVRYNIRCIRNGEVTIANIFKSISINGGGYSYPVRPVVTLSYDIEIGEKVDNVWQIK